MESGITKGKEDVIFRNFIVHNSFFDVYLVDIQLWVQDMVLVNIEFVPE